MWRYKFYMAYRKDVRIKRLIHNLVSQVMENEEVPKPAAPEVQKQDGKAR